MDPERIARKQASERKPQGSRKEAARRKISTISWPASLIFNLLIATTLSLFLISEEIANYSCVSLKVNVVSVALVLTCLLQLVWRYLGEAIKSGRGNVHTQSLKASLSMIFAVLDRLHFARWKAWILWTMTGVSVALALLCLGPISPFRNPEMPPFIKIFSLTRNGIKVAINPSGVTEVQSGDSLQITAVIREPVGTRCTWSEDRGRFSAVDNCKATYLAPLDGAVDNLSVRVRSTCGTQDSYAGLSFRLTPD